ncbi:MAG: DUF6516 family protein [Anaerolineae bacterium]
MRDIARYFDRIDSLIRHSLVVDDEVTYRQWTSTSGVIEGALQFHDGSRLEFTEIVRLIGREVQKRRYRYQYLEGNQQVFRYDNAPHHAHLSTFPHHRHDEKGQAMEAEEVSLKEVLDEIGDLLAA